MRLNIMDLMLRMCHNIFSHAATAPSGIGPPSFRGFTITLRHTTLGRTPLDEWSAWRRDLYPTQHPQGTSCQLWDSNPHSQQTGGRRPKP